MSNMPFRLRVLGVLGLTCLVNAVGIAAPSKDNNGSENLRAHSDLTALDRYVAAPDTNYSFSVVKSVAGQGTTTYILELTSQAWLTTNEVDRPIWKHWLILIKPDTVTSSKSFLFISGGANDGKVPNGSD